MNGHYFIESNMKKKLIFRLSEEELEYVYTPKHGSWLNMAECEFNVPSRQCLSRRLPNIDTVRSEVNAWTVSRNQAGGTVNWRFTIENSRRKLKQLYLMTADVN